MTDIAAIGECMLELVDDESGSLALSYGGDVFNTALYARRKGASVSFVSALGDDHYSRWLLEQWAEEDIDCRHVRILPGTTPSLYIIRNSSTGERSFHYWRSASPYSSLLDDSVYRRRLEAALAGFKLVYLSGISLAMLDDAPRNDLIAILSEYRKAGGRVAFDPNYRARLWPDAQSAVTWADRLYQISDIALPSLDDEQALHPEESARAVIDRIRQHGLQEIVLKCGSQGYWLADQMSSTQVEIAEVIRAVDTTAAGDSFNAAYLCGRLRGESRLQSARDGAQLAATVIQHPGAIMPREDSLVKEEEPG